MFFVVLLILRKLLTELIIGYYLQSSLIVIKHSCAMLLLVCWHIGIAINRSSFVGKAIILSHFILEEVLDREA